MKPLNIHLMGRTDMLAFRSCYLTVPHYSICVNMPVDLWCWYEITNRVEGFTHSVLHRDRLWPVVSKDLRKELTTI